MERALRPLAAILLIHNGVHNTSLGQTLDKKFLDARVNGWTTA